MSIFEEIKNENKLKKEYLETTKENISEGGSDSESSDEDMDVYIFLTKTFYILFNY